MKKLFVILILVLFWGAVSSAAGLEDRVSDATTMVVENTVDAELSDAEAYLLTKMTFAAMESHDLDDNKEGNSIGLIIFIVIVVIVVAYIISRFENGMLILFCACCMGAAVLLGFL